MKYELWVKKVRKCYLGEQNASWGSKVRAPFWRENKIIIIIIILTFIVGANLAALLTCAHLVVLSLNSKRFAIFKVSATMSSPVLSFDSL